VNDSIVNVEQENVWLSGQVIRRTGTGTEPAANENVQASFAGKNYWALSDENGNFSILLRIPPSPGVYTAKVWLIDTYGLYQENSLDLQAMKGTISLIPEAPVALVGDPFKFYGYAYRWIDETTYEPVANNPVQVLISGMGLENSYTVQTADNGYYEVWHTFTVPGWYDIEVSFEDPDGIRGENLRRNFLAGRKVRFTGHFRTLEGIPLSGYLEFVKYGAAEAFLKIETVENGDYDGYGFAGKFDVKVHVDLSNVYGFENIWIEMLFKGLDLDNLQHGTELENFLVVDASPLEYLVPPSCQSSLLGDGVRFHRVFTDNYENLRITFCYAGLLGTGKIGDIKDLRIWRSENYDYEAREITEWYNLSGPDGIYHAQDTTYHTLTVWDTRPGHSENVFYALAEYQPGIEEVTEQLQEAAQTTTEAAEFLENMAAELEETVEVLATQENLEALENMIEELYENFTVTPETLVLTLYQGENTTTAITVASEVDQTLMITGEIVGEITTWGEYLIADLEPQSFTLDPRASRQVAFSVVVHDLMLEGMYTGRIIFSDGFQEKTVTVFVNVLPSDLKKLENVVEVTENLRGIWENIEDILGEMLELENTAVTTENRTERIREELQALWDDLTALWSDIQELMGTISVNPPRLHIVVYQGRFQVETLTVTSRVETALTLTVEASNGFIAWADRGLLSITFDPPSFALPAKESQEIVITVTAHDLMPPGTYTGKVIIRDAATEVTVPTTIEVRPRGGLFDFKIKALTKTLSPGQVLQLEMDLMNMGLVDADADYAVWIVDPAGNIVGIENATEKVRAGQTVAKIFSYELPENVLEGTYTIMGTAEYLQDGQRVEISAADTAKVKYPPKPLAVLGIPIGILIALIIGLAGAGTTGYFVYKFHQKRLRARRRFEARLWLEELPRPGPSVIRVGRLAEAAMDSFVNLDDLRMHVMTAGATGGGKTISSMVIAEEALLKGKNVIVFDPTAQWTGFLRKCTDKKMLSHYPRFGMKESEARGFPGVVKLIVNPRQKIDMGELLGEAARGKITVFVIERLKPGDADIFVTNVIQSIFESQPREHPELKTLIIFDEVHRLLPRFGGTGAGVIQLERACREFRKWGIGVMLISQVMGDFEEEIRTNIRTQVQFWTREGAELERITKTYGEEHMRSVSKAPIGFGMVVNPDYNRGRPYYVNFRPILHAVRRLSPEELDKYYQADDRIENVKFKLKKLEEKGVDVFDMRIELGLAQRKLEEASFDMVNAYLDTLEPRVDDLCARRGLKDIKREIELRSEREIKEAQMAAIKERERRLAMMKRPPEIVEAYKELLAPKKEVVHAPEVSKPLREEKKEEVHPEAAKVAEEMVHPEAAKEEEMIHPEAKKEMEEAKAVEKVEKPEKLKLEERPKKARPSKKKANGGVPVKPVLRTPRRTPPRKRAKTCAKKRTNGGGLRGKAKRRRRG
jgi:hypothetical protein